MSGNIRWTWTVILASLLGVSLACVGCDSSQAGKDTQDDTANAPGLEAEPDASSEQQVENAEARVEPEGYDVPEGDASELVQYMSAVVGEPQGETDEERTYDLQRQMEARIIAAERLLRLTDSEDLRRIAIRTKLESLRVLAMIGQERAAEDFKQLTTDLIQQDNPDFARIGRICAYQSQLDQFVTAGAEDETALMESLTLLVEREGPQRSVFDAVSETAMTLSHLGLEDASAQAYALIADHFSDHQEPDIADAAKHARTRTQLQRMRLAFNAVAEDQQGAPAELKAAAKAALSGDNPNGDAVAAVLDLAHRIEDTGTTGLAQTLYLELQEAAGRIADPAAKKTMSDAVSKGLTRLQLLGQPVEIAGQTIDGEPFDWSQFKGKIVVVDFWATWCGPCIAEMPHLRKLLDQYQDQGLEVVGICLDNQLESVRGFVETNALPWVTVVSTDANARGFRDPNAVTCGVDRIPFLMVVSRSGKVDALQLRGEALDEYLAELFANHSRAPTANAVHPTEPPAAGDPGAEASGDIEMDTLPDGPDGAGAREGEATETDPSDEDDSSEEVGANPLDMEETETLPPTETKPSDHEAAGNPYLIEETSTGSALVLRLLELSDKPKSVQVRPGFRDAMVDASDRILKESANSRHRKVAAKKKLDYLHRDAQRGDDDAQQQLTAFVAQLDRDAPELVPDDVAFFQLEQQVMEAEQPSVALLDSSCAYLEGRGEALSDRDLRLASTTVELVNQLEGKQREPYFQRIGKALLASKSREVNRYGRRLANVAGSIESQIGKTFELKGMTTDGVAFDIVQCRKQVVLVDFWATWCGPCTKVHPEVMALTQRHMDLRVVSVSLDADEKALAAFLANHEMPGVVLFGNAALKAAEQYAVSGIPAFFVLDGEGTIQAVDHDLAKLTDRIDVQCKLLKRELPAE